MTQRARGANALLVLLTTVAACWCLVGGAHTDTVRLVPRGSLWRFVDGGGLPGANWKGDDFDDSIPF